MARKAGTPRAPTLATATPTPNLPGYARTNEVDKGAGHTQAPPLAIAEHSPTLLADTGRNDAERQARQVISDEAPTLSTAELTDSECHNLGTARGDDSNTRTYPPPPANTVWKCWSRARKRRFEEQVRAVERNSRAEWKASNRQAVQAVAEEIRATSDQTDEDLSIEEVPPELVRPPNLPFSIHQSHTRCVYRGGFVLCPSCQCMGTGSSRRNQLLLPCPGKAGRSTGSASRARRLHRGILPRGDTWPDGTPHPALYQLG